MDIKCRLFLGIILCLTVVSDSGIVVPRDHYRYDSSGNGEVPVSVIPLEADKKIDPEPEILSPPSVYDDEDMYDGEPVIDAAKRPSSSDYYPDIDVKVDDILPDIESERFPSDADQEDSIQGNPGEEEVAGKLDNENFSNKSLDEDVSDESGNNDEDLRSFPDKDSDESEIDSIRPEESEENNSDNEHKPEIEDKFDEERKEEEVDEMRGPENMNEKKFIPGNELIDDDDDDENAKKESPNDINDNNDDENIPREEETGSVFGGSMFDTPFFDIEQVKKYLIQLRKAFGHIFRQTVDEALLLNGTYANTTEEEVDIDGKKYIVTKSIIKGADNHSSIYVEALSSKPKMDETEIAKDTDIGNVTHA